MSKKQRSRIDFILGLVFTAWGCGAIVLVAFSLGITVCAIASNW